MRHKLIQEFYDSPEYLSKLRAKVQRMKEMEADPYARAAHIVNIYSVDPIAFIEDFLMLKMTEGGGSAKPFFLFEYQKKVIRQIHEWDMSKLDVEALVDKPRGMGITWLLCAYFLWRWLYTPNYSIFILSRTETEVDDGSSLPDNSIFGKLRWMISRLPSYMIPEGYVAKKNRGTTTDMNLKLINPTMGSSINGSSTNSNAGRSRRYNAIFIDECFAIDQFSAVYKALQSVSFLKLFVSTVKAGRVFKSFKDMVEEKGHYISLTWRDHPFKDQEWYEEQLKKAEFDPDVMKEIDVDYAINPKAQYYPQVRESKILPLIYDPGKPLYCGLDFGGRQDLSVIIWFQYDGQFIRVLDAYWSTNKPAEWYAPFLNASVQWNPDFYSKPQQDILNKLATWKRPMGYFGELDHTVKKMPTNKSIADELIRYQIKVIYNQYGIKHEPRHEATSRLLPKTIFNQDSDGAMRTYDAIMDSRYSSAAHGTSENLKPVHDNEIADFRAAFENFAVNFSRILKAQRQDISPEQASFARGIMALCRV